MKFFKFSIDVFQWKAVLQQGKQMRKVFVPIDNEEWVKEANYPIKMDLVDGYQDISEWKGSTPFDDVIQWSSDFTLGGLTHKGGAFIIMTQKVKEVLEKYKLPPHRFYPTELYCKHYKETRKDYFVFHMIGNGVYGDEYIDYIKCTFVESERDSEYDRIKVKEHPEGIVESLDSYNEIAFGENSFLGTWKETLGSGEINIQRNDLDFINKVYKHDYDVLWGLPNVIYISEEIKKELEAIKVTSGGFFPVKENMIRSFEYEQLKNS